MARRRWSLATNQGLLYVLSMVVIGGLVGAGASATSSSRVLADRAVRQGPRRRHRDRGARRHARPDHAVRRRPVRAGLSARSDEDADTRLSRRGARKGEKHGTRTTTQVRLVACRRRVRRWCWPPAAAATSRRPTPTASGGGLRRPQHRRQPLGRLRANAHVVGYVAQNELGCNVDVHGRKEEVGWQGLADGAIDTVIENWGHPDLMKKYIDEQGTVAGRRARPATRASSAGTCRQWMAEEYPDITDWKNLNKYADMFETSESGGKGQLSTVTRPTSRTTRR